MQYSVFRCILCTVEIFRTHYGFNKILAQTQLCPIPPGTQMVNRHSPMLDISARPGWLPVFHTAIRGSRWVDGLALAVAGTSMLRLVNFPASEAMSLFYSTDFSKMHFSIS